MSLKVTYESLSDMEDKAVAINGIGESEEALIK
jgi:hypothetical protein